LATFNILQKEEKDQLKMRFFYLKQRVTLVDGH